VGNCSVTDSCTVVFGTATGSGAFQVMAAADAEFETIRIQAREAIAFARRTCAASPKIIQQSNEAIEHSHQLIAKLNKSRERVLERNIFRLALRNSAPRFQTKKPGRQARTL
jgi:hypothetical protein